LEKAIGLLESTAEEPGHPDVFRTWLHTRAGNMRMSRGDADGARTCFTKALAHVPCSVTIDARMALASLDVKAGQLQAALVHLRAAVAEGSGACSRISKERKKTLKALFEAEDEGIRKEAELLTDAARADEPVRAEIRKALETAKKEGKKVLVEFYGPYCPYVMAMEERLARPRIKEVIAKKYILYRVDTGAGHKATTLDKEYLDEFENYGVPGFFVLAADGTIQTPKKCGPELMGAEHRCYDELKVLDFLEEAGK